MRKSLVTALNVVIIILIAVALSTPLISSTNELTQNNVTQVTDRRYFVSYVEEEVSNDQAPTPVVSMVTKTRTSIQMLPWRIADTLEASKAMLWTVLTLAIVNLLALGMHSFINAMEDEEITALLKFQPSLGKLIHWCLGLQVVLSVLIMSVILFGGVVYLENEKDDCTMQANQGVSCSFIAVPSVAFYMCMLVLLLTTPVPVWMALRSTLAPNHVNGMNGRIETWVRSQKSSSSAYFGFLFEFVVFDRSLQIK